MVVRVITYIIICLIFVSCEVSVCVGMGCRSSRSREARTRGSVLVRGRVSTTSQISAEVLQHHLVRPLNYESRQPIPERSHDGGSPGYLAYIRSMIELAFVPGLSQPVSRSFSSNDWYGVPMSSSK